MLPRIFPLSVASTSRRVPSGQRIAVRRGTAAGVVAVLACTGTLTGAVGGHEPADAATRRTVRPVTRRTPVTTVAPRVTSTLVPATVAVASLVRG